MLSGKLVVWIVGMGVAFSAFSSRCDVMLFLLQKIYPEHIYMI